MEKRHKNPDEEVRIGVSSFAHLKSIRYRLTATYEYLDHSNFVCSQSELYAVYRWFHVCRLRYWRIGLVGSDFHSLWSGLTAGL